MIQTKKFNIIAFMVLLMGFIFISGAGIAGAHGVFTGDNVSLNQKDKIDNTVIASGRTVDISSEVNGDIFCAAQSVTISGPVHGDVICAAQTIHITGDVDGDVRLAAQTVTINGQVAGNATVAGQTFNLSSESKVNGDVSLGVTDATLNGIIGRDLGVDGGNVSVANQIGRDIKGNIETLRFSQNARVMGNIEIRSKNEISKDSRSIVDGVITKTEPTESDTDKDGPFGLGLIWYLYCLIAMIVTSLALILLFPSLIHNVTNQAMRNPWKTLAIGFLGSVAAPIITIILLATVVGIPLALLFILVWLITLFLSSPLFGYYIGRLMLKNAKNPIVIMLVGSVLLTLVIFIPVIGIIGYLAMIWFGVGMIVQELLIRTPRPAYNFDDSKSIKRKNGV